jgi:hypothetical protein
VGFFMGDEEISRVEKQDKKDEDDKQYEKDKNEPE